MLYKKIIDLFKLLPEKGKKSFLKIIGLSILNSIVDISVLSTLFPLIYILTHQEIILQNKYLLNLFHFFHFSSSTTLIIVLFLIVILAFAFRALFMVYVYYKQSSLAYSIGDLFFESMNKFIFYQDIISYKKMSYGEIEQNARTVPYQLAYLILVPMALILTEILVIAFLLTAIVVYNPILFVLIFIFVFLPTAFVYKLFKNKIASFGKNMHQVAIQSNNFIKNLIRGYADIYLLHRQEYFIDKVLKSQQSYNRINQRIQTIQQAFPKMIEWIAIASVFMIFLFFIWKGNNYTEMALTITVYFTSAYRIMPSINRMNASLLMMKQYEHLIDIYKNIHHQQKNEHTVNTLLYSNSMPFENKIELKNISVSYSETKDKWVLKDISLTIKKGEMIGLIGESGSGKTTLMYVLAALIKPDKGNMTVDDTQIDDANKFLWHKHAAIVYQEPYIIDGNWIDNIVFGGLEMKEDKIWECLKMVQLYDYVKQLPKQLYENIGDSGSFLSGGQKQRLALARSLYRNADVLFLDEATSALDEETQKEIMQTIDNIRQSQDITVIMIAHRYSSLQHCDKIYFLNKGVIEKEITYRELILNSK